MFENWPVYCGIGSCTISGIFLFYYRNSSRYLNVLQNIEELEVNNGLHEKVKSAGGNIPYVALNGVVSPDGKVIHGVHNTASKGVIRETTMIEHKSKWNPLNKSWVDGKRTISTTWQVEPFSLAGKHSNTKVTVINPRSADTLELIKVADNYEPHVASVGERVLDLVAGEHVKGIQILEKMLLCNSDLTIIGEVTYHDGRLSINASSNDDTLKYILTDEYLAGIIKSEKDLRSTWKVLSVIFLLIGGGFCSYWLYKHINIYLEKKRYFRLRQEMEEFNENNDIDDSHVCTVCMTEPRDVVFLPCGHVCVCTRCSDMVNSCPVCRGQIDSRSPVFFS